MSDEDDLNALADPKTPDLERRVLVTRLPGLVAQVSPASRVVLVLHYMEDFSLPEVADVLGIPLGTVKSRLAHGLRLLRRELGVGPAAHENGTAE